MLREREVGASEKKESAAARAQKRTKI